MEGCLIIWEVEEPDGALGRLRESSFMGHPYMGPSSNP